jgi:hypothetical protein
MCSQCRVRINQGLQVVRSTSPLSPRRKLHHQGDAGPDNAGISVSSAGVDGGGFSDVSSARF